MQRDYILSASFYLLFSELAFLESSRDYHILPIEGILV